MHAGAGPIAPFFTHASARGCSSPAVAIVRSHAQDGLLAETHLHDPLVPAADNLPYPDGKLKGAALGAAGVKARAPVGKRPDITFNCLRFAEYLL